MTRVSLRSWAREQESRDWVGKPTVAALGVDLAVLDWQRSGTGPGSFEVAFVASESGSQPVTTGLPGTARPPDHTTSGVAAEWVLLRVADDPADRVLVYDRNEWLCFLDGAAHGEFDWRQDLACRLVA